MKKQSALSTRARVARATASASGLALIMGLVNVAVGAEVSIKAETSTPPTITASDSLATITPQYLNKSVEGTVTGAAFSNVSAGSTISSLGNIVAAEAGGNKASSSTAIDLLDTTADFSISSGQVVDLDGTQSMTAAIDGPLINVVFAAPVSDATLNDNTANAQVTVNKSVASIAQANL
ncbi:hypothetical protein D7I39_03370 [Allopusillimonas ginsengisoli]|nr:hypothetical protein D7I39_03370 [Allopusillimonas ginsengisoli]